MRRALRPVSTATSADRCVDFMPQNTGVQRVTYPVRRFGTRVHRCGARGLVWRTECLFSDPAPHVAAFCGDERAAVMCGANSRGRTVLKERTTACQTSSLSVNQTARLSTSEEAP